MYAVVESVNTFTPLGMRFWDPAFDQMVHAGLSVTARRLSGRTVCHAQRTPGDIYYFASLPGLKAMEHQPFGNRPPEPAGVHDFIIEVQDIRGRFLPAAFAVALPLPYNGLFLSAGPGSPSETLPGVHLFSAPTRAAASSHAQVRAELIDSTNGAPAAHALVEVAFGDGTVITGISDSEGRVAVIAPLPRQDAGLPVSPPPSGRGQPLSERIWDVSIQVRYEPSAQRSLPGAELPDYASLFTQGYAEFGPIGSPGLVGAASMVAQITFATPLILRNSDDSPGLLVSPATTSP